MSYDITLYDPASGDVVRVLPHNAGGTPCAFRIVDEWDAVATGQVPHDLERLAEAIDMVGPTNAPRSDAFVSGRVAATRAVPEPLTRVDMQYLLSLPPGILVRFNERIIAIGDDRAAINSTSNYAPFYRDQIDPHAGIRWLYGKRASDTLARLSSAVDHLVTDRYDGPYYRLILDLTAPARHPELLAWVRALLQNGAVLSDPQHADLLGQALTAGIVYDGGGYWRATPGNAGAPLAVMRTWAQQWPDAVWDGD